MADSDAQLAEEALKQARAERSTLTEREKMLNGDAYLAMDDVELIREDPSEKPDFYGPERRKVLEELFGMPNGEILRLAIEIEPPFYCDYGTNIKFTGPFYSNYGCTILDCAQVTLGSRILFAPDVHIYAATHSTDVAERRAGLERAYPVTIGDDVWVGGGARIIGPCKIGDGVTLAAGSVARGVLEPYCVYGGVPARLLKRLKRPEEEKA